MVRILPDLGDSSGVAIGISRGHVNRVMIRCTAGLASVSPVMKAVTGHPKKVRWSGRPITCYLMPNQCAPELVEPSGLWQSASFSRVCTLLHGMERPLCSCQAAWAHGPRGSGGLAGGVGG